MSARGAYHLRRQSGAESFRAAWEAALQLGVARIEDVVMDRALNGVEEPVYSYGKLIGTRRRYNDRLLMFILRNRAPERFADGRSKALNAIGRMQLEQLKEKWRKEWEAERPKVTQAEVRASIERKIAQIRKEVEAERAALWAQMSDETKTAWARFVELRERDLAAIKANAEGRKLIAVEWNARAETFSAGGTAPGAGAADAPEPLRMVTPKEAAPPEEPPQRPPEGWSYGKPKPAPPPRTQWTLKDESFDP